MGDAAEPQSQLLEPAPFETSGRICGTSTNSPMEADWHSVLATLGLTSRDLLSVSAIDTERRCYVRDHKLYKLSRAEGTSSTRRVRTPLEEAALLRRLMPLRVTPQAISYKELSGFSCLSYNIVEGVPLSQTDFSLHFIWRLFGVLTKI